MSLDCTDSHLMELLHALQNQAEALVGIHLDEIFGRNSQCFPVFTQARGGRY